MSYSNILELRSDQDEARLARQIADEAYNADFDSAPAAPLPPYVSRKFTDEELAEAFARVEQALSRKGGC